MTDPEATSELQMQLLLARGICFLLKYKKKMVYFDLSDFCPEKSNIKQVQS